MSDSHDTDPHSLKKTLGGWQVLFYGLGSMLGAGVYALIGRAAENLGNSVWLAFLVAMIAAMLAAHSHADFVSAVRALDRVLLSGFYIVPLFHAPEQWFAHSTALARPDRTARFAAPLFGATLDSWWRKAP